MSTIDGGAESQDQQAVKASILFSRASNEGVLRKFRNFPLIRFLIAALFFLPLVGLNMAVVYLGIDNLPEPQATWLDMARLAVMFPALIYFYRLFARKIEQREAYEFTTKGALSESLVGILAAVFIIGGTVAVMWATGVYRIVGFNEPSLVFNFLLLYATGSLLQEIMARLLIFRLTEEMFGTWAAIIISSVIFGLLHAANPNQTPLSIFTLTITSFAFIGPFILTRRIWMVWGVHFGWNFTQAGIFGMPNSGIPFSGWIEPVIEGPLWLTGGAVGVENSALTVGLALLVSWVFFVMVRKRKQFIGPMWKR